MKKISGILLMIFFINFTLSGCWNYREVEELWMVAGAAIDWDMQDKKYIITAEIIKHTGTKETQMDRELITFKSDTLFDAMRKGISMSGRVLYWAHTNVLIISEPVARKGIVPILDLLSRGKDFRSNIYLAVSKESTAQEILRTKTKLYDAVSFQLTEIFKSQKNVSSFINSQVWYFQKDYLDEGISAVLSAVKVSKNNGEFIPQLYGSAVFKKDKMIGYINDMYTKSLLLVRNNLKGGVIVVKDVANTKTNVSLEILKNNTTILPEIKNGSINMNMKVVIDVAIPEIEGAENFLSDEGRVKLKNDASRTVKEQIKELLITTQENLGSDILGFGKDLQKKEPKEWKMLQPNWDETFKSVKTNIDVAVNLISSYASYKTITVGD